MKSAVSPHKLLFFFSKSVPNPVIIGTSLGNEQNYDLKRRKDRSWIEISSICLNQLERVYLGIYCVSLFLFLSM